MKMTVATFLLVLLVPWGTSAAEADRYLILSESDLRDRIHGGFIGQIFGNLNGLPHEMKYIHEPGRVEQYVPALPEGARTDDDTDLEWIYITEMVGTDAFVPPPRIRQLWQRHINRSIWCANLYARQLMDLGIEPPLTGRIAINPWSEFNISGQFICESFGLAAPGMPQTASRIGLHYTQVTIDGEPAQTTQLFCTMIAAAFVEQDLEVILDAGLAAVDPESVIARIVSEVQQWHREQPDDWRATRQRIKERYQRHGGEMRDRNGYELNTASTIAALLYGQGDLAETLRLAFNFGWDCDNNAATAATIIGVLRGRKWIEQQGWTLRDLYRNTTRDHMPDDETLSGFADKIVAVAREVIRKNGGSETRVNGQKTYRIRIETPTNLQPLPRPLDRRAELQAALSPEVDRDLSGDEQARARAAYLALCLGEADRWRRDRAEDWARAVAALQSYTNVVREIFAAPHPNGAALQREAQAAGLRPPPTKPDSP